VVSSVDGSEIVVGKKTYIVDENAKITVNGKKASVSAIQAGMRALITGKVISRGKTTAESLYEATRITARSK
jgi:hypothetical protein